jgi:hypothetical protein
MSPELDRAILRAMEKDRDRRWPTAADFAAALAVVPEGRAGPQLADPMTPTAAAAAARRRRTTSGPSPGGNTPTADVPMPLTAGRKRVRRVRWGRAVLVGLIISAALVAGLYVASERGLIDVDLGWFRWLPWSDWDPFGSK